VSLKTRFWTLGLLLFGLVLVWDLQSERFPIVPTDPGSTATEPLANDRPAPDMTYLPVYAHRKTYPYSVIPGGVASVEELKDAISHDPVVARHLEDFNVQTAKLVKVAAARPVYVSYRRGSRIFWTTRPITLSKGETVITDGKRTLRGRCGNDVSALPEAPTSDEEPTDEELETPLPAFETLNSVIPDPALDPSGYQVPHYGFPILPPSAGAPPLYSVTPVSVPVIFSGGGGTPQTPPAPPIATPEPSTSVLLFFGVVGVAARRIWRKRIVN
jgi:hypothetical protein